jgi:hypothetical protein
MGCQHSTPINQHHYHTRCILVLEMQTLLKPDKTAYDQTDWVLSWCQKQICVAVVSETAAEVKAFQRLPLGAKCCWVGIFDPTLKHVRQYFRADVRDIIYITNQPHQTTGIKEQGIWTVLIRPNYALNPVYLETVLRTNAEFESKSGDTADDGSTKQLDDQEDVGKNQNHKEN